MRELTALRIDELPRRKPKKALKRSLQPRLGRKTRKATKKPKKPSISKLTKKLDSLVSEWVRRKDADRDGITTCFTSGARVHWKKIQNGHYVSRSVKALRWHEDNMRPQSVAENIFKNGNPISFRENLIADIGEDRVKELESRRKELFRPSKEFLEFKIKEYLDKLAAV